MEQRNQLRPIKLNSRVVKYRLSDVDGMLAALIEAGKLGGAK
jgi:hypothetical protein